MLTNRRVFNRLMAVLRAVVNGRFFISKEIEDYLWENMDEITTIKKTQPLCYQGRVPTHAYFVVRGLIMLSYEDRIGKRHLPRVYREDRICGLISFILQLPSLYRIDVTKGGMLLCISHKALEGLYAIDNRMKEFVYATSMHFEHYKEQLRENLLFDKTADEKVAEFYEAFPGLLNTRRIMLDEDIALYLHTSKTALKRSRGVYEERLGR